MPITHVNRKRDTYYLHCGKTKTGKPRYWFAKSTEGDLVESIPEGYEVYENPDALVFLRKKGDTMSTRRVLLEIDLASVSSSDEFFEVVSEAFGLSARWTHPCGGKWDAFYEAIELRDDLPERLRLHGWCSIEARLPDDARLFVECLDELSVEYPGTAPSVERLG